MSIWSDAARDAYRKTHRFPNQPNVNGGSGPVIKKKDLALEARLKLAETVLTKPKLGRPHGEWKPLDKDVFDFARRPPGPKLG